MTKTQGKKLHDEADSRGTKPKPTKVKAKEEPNKDILLARVKKAIKKSRRKLNEEKFEKELRRTIAFLGHLRSKLAGSNNSAGEMKKVKGPKGTKNGKPESDRKRVRPSTTVVKSSQAAASSLRRNR
jgi:hypothetical protein